MSTDTQIPERGTKEFLEYAASVMKARADGKDIQCRLQSMNNWTLNNNPAWNWMDYDFRVAPAPHPIDQWRAMTAEEREGKVLEYVTDHNIWHVSIHSIADQNETLVTRDTVESADKYRIRIRTLPLAERNAEVRAKWEAMEETDDASVRVKDGKRWTWEFRKNERDPWATTIRNSQPAFFQFQEYRLVELPAPKFVPWTRETCPRLPFEVRADSNRYSVAAFVDKQLHISGLGCRHPHQLLADGWTMYDGTPCGTEVKP